MFGFSKRKTEDNSQPELRSYLNTIATTYENYLNTLTSGGTIKFNDAYFENISTVNICVKSIADKFALLPIGIYKKIGRDKILQVDDPRYRLLNQYPTPYLSAFPVKHFWESQRGYKANSFSIIQRDKNFMPIALTPVYSNEVTGYYIKDNNLFYKINGMKDVGFMNILHFRMQTMDSPSHIPGIWGKTAIESLRLNLSLSYKAIKTVDNIYENEAKTTGYFEVEIINANKNAIEEWKKKMKDENGGFEKAGGLGYLMPPGVKRHETPISVNDALFLNTVKFNAGQIASWYGLPAYKVGLDDARNTGKSLEALSQEFKSDTLDPILKMYKDELEFKLLTDEEIREGYSIEFDTKVLIALDHKTKAEIQKIYTDMTVLTPNQICEEENYPTFEGGDDRYMFNQNMNISKDASKN